jgi:hypothetical protein
MLDGKAYRANFSPDDAAYDVSIMAEALRRLNAPLALVEALAALEVRTILALASQPGASYCRWASSLVVPS